MRDHDPIVLRRMLALRQFSLLAGVDLGELAALAENVVELTLPVGTVVAAAGEAVVGVHFVIDGRLDSATSSWGTRDAHGAFEALAHREIAYTAIATEPTRTLRASSADFGDVIDDNFGVLQSVLRDVALRVVATHPAARGAPHVATAGPLGLVERLVVWRHQLPFADAPVHALAMLAHASDEVNLPTGTTVSRARDLATRAFVIVDGKLRGRRGDGAAASYGPGDAIGLLETLAAAPHGVTTETVTPVRALTSTGAVLFDVLEDHAEVGRAMLATFARALIDAAADATPITAARARR